MSETREKTYETQYQKYVEAYEKIERTKEVAQGGHMYSFKQFKSEFQLQEKFYKENKMKYNKYNIYKDLAKSHQRYTDKQLHAFREQFKTKRDNIKAKLRAGQELTPQEQQSLFMLKQYDMWDNEIANYKIYPIMSQIITIFSHDDDFYLTITT